MVRDTRSEWIGDRGSNGSKLNNAGLAASRCDHTGLGMAINCSGSDAASAFTSDRWDLRSRISLRSRSLGKDDGGEDGKGDFEVHAEGKLNVF